MASRSVCRKSKWHQVGPKTSKHGPKVVARGPARLPNQPQDVQHSPQVSPKKESMATKMAPRSPAWHPSGFQVDLKSPTWLFGIRLCMPEVQHGAQVGPKRAKMTLRINMFPLNLHLATSTSMKLLAFTPMSVPRLYASWLMRTQQNRDEIRTAHGRRSYQDCSAIKLMLE